MWWRTKIHRDFTDKDDSMCYERDIDKWPKILVDLSMTLFNQSQKNHCPIEEFLLHNKSFEELEAIYNEFLEICDPERCQSYFCISSFVDKKMTGIISRLANIYVYSIYNNKTLI